MRKTILGVILFVFGLSSDVFAKTFIFTAIPDEDESRLRSRIDQVAHYLQDQLGVDVQYVPVKSYAAAIPLSSLRNWGW